MGKTAKRKPVGLMQQMIDQQQASEAARSLVNEFAASKGDYIQAGRFGTGRKVMLNRGGTPIDRWKRDGQLSDTQLAAIDHCRRLWHLIDCGPRLVANLDRTVFGCPGNGNPREIEARGDIHRIKSGFPLPYWSVFEDVCRHDEPAGYAGSRLASDSRTATTAARLVVAMVADTIYMRERLSY